MSFGFVLGNRGVYALTHEGCSSLAARCGDTSEGPTGYRYKCKECGWAGRAFPPDHPRGSEKSPLLSLLDKLEAKPEPPQVIITAPPAKTDLPPITKEKRAYANRVVKSEAQVLMARQFFPHGVEPTEWLHVDAVAAGFGYGDYESCIAAILGIKKPFRIKYLDPFDGAKWYRRDGAKTYFSRQVIEAFSVYRVSTFPGKPSGQPFNWESALAVSPIVPAPQPAEPTKPSSDLVRRSPVVEPLADPWDDAIEVVAKPSMALDPNIAPTLAEFAQAVADGKLPAPDVEFMGVPLYRAATLSRFKTGGAIPKDFTQNFATVPTLLNLSNTGIPSELSALSEYSGVEFYRVEGATDHRLAIGIKAGGRSRDEGTLRHALAQHGFIMKPSEKHLVTAWLALDYLGEARDNKALASQVKGIKDRGLERQMNSEAARLEDPSVGNDGIKAALVPELRREIDEVKNLIIRGQKENETGFKRIEATILKLQSTINGLEYWNPTGYQDSVDWLAKLNTLERSMAGMGNSLDEIQQQLGEELRNKRDRVNEKVRDLHIRFVHFRYHGHCPVTHAKIVGEDPKTGEPVLLKDSDGKPLGQVDHNFQVNRAGKLSTWLIESGLNQKLNHDEKERIKVQIYFTAYQQSLEDYDCPLLNLVA